MSDKLIKEVKEVIADLLTELEVQTAYLDKPDTETTKIINDGYETLGKLDRI